jgi:hypothetical protein
MRIAMMDTSMQIGLTAAARTASLRRLAAPPTTSATPAAGLATSRTAAGRGI